METQPNFIRIQEYSLPDFAFALQRAVEQGYSIVEDNENYPNLIGVLMTCGMRKNNNTSNSTSNNTSTSANEVVSEAVAESETKRGRKPKV